MMFPAGSRLLIGATVLTALVATIYGVTNGGSLGTTGLISAACGLAVLTAINLYTRDADVSAMDSAALTDSAAAHRAPWPSLWPAVGALGALLVVVGLVTYPVVFVLGIVALLAATVEWMLQAWSERASGDETYNSEVRQRFAHPAEFPVLGRPRLRRHRLLVQPDHAGAVARTAARRRSPRSPPSSSAPASSSPSGATSTARSSAGSPPSPCSPSSPAESPPPSRGEREIHPHETIEDVAAAGECGVEEMRSRRERLAERRRQGQPVRRDHPAPTTMSWSPPSSTSPARRAR